MASIQYYEFAPRRDSAAGYDRMLIASTNIPTGLLMLPSWMRHAPVAIVLTAALAVSLTSCGGGRATPDTAPAAPSEDTALNERDAQLDATTFAPDLNVVLLAMTRMPTGIYYRDVEEGTGVPAMPGREVLMTYIAYLADGSEVDRTAPGARPLAFKVGEGTVIRGWDLGVRGMRTGGTRQLVVPSRYAYGSRTVGKVPPNAVMVFVVRLDGVR